MELSQKNGAPRQNQNPTNISHYVFSRLREVPSLLILHVQANKSTFKVQNDGKKKAVYNLHFSSSFSSHIRVGLEFYGPDFFSSTTGCSYCAVLAIIDIEQFLKINFKIFIKNIKKIALFCLTNE
jgi:hypothetical protein